MEAHIPISRTATTRHVAGSLRHVHSAVSWHAFRATCADLKGWSRQGNPPRPRSRSGRSRQEQHATNKQRCSMVPPQRTSVANGCWRPTAAVPGVSPVRTLHVKRSMLHTVSVVCYLPCHRSWRFFGIRKPSNRHVSPYKARYLRTDTKPSILVQRFMAHALDMMPHDCFPVPVGDICMVLNDH